MGQSNRGAQKTKQNKQTKGMGMKDRGSSEDIWKCLCAFLSCPKVGDTISLQ